MITTNAENFVIFPVRCFTCGVLLSGKEKDYQQKLQQGKTIDEAMTELGFDKYCCRMNVINPPKFAIGKLKGVKIGDIMEIQRPNDVMARNAAYNGNTQTTIITDIPVTKIPLIVPAPLDIPALPGMDPNLFGTQPIGAITEQKAPGIPGLPNLPKIELDASDFEELSPEDETLKPSDFLSVTGTDGVKIYRAR